MLAVAGGKGGVGKTTVALSVAAALARRGAAPVVADADRTMPNLHVAAETPVDPGVAALAGGGGVAGALHRSPRLPGVRILPTAPGTDGPTLRGGLRRLAAEHEHDATADSLVAPLLLDCPAGAGRDAALPLELAARTLLVSTPRRASLTDAAKTAAMARALDAPPVGCVLTRTAAPREGIERLLGCPVLACVPSVADPLSGVQITDRAEYPGVRGPILPGTFNRVAGLLLADVDDGPAGHGGGRPRPEAQRGDPSR